MKKTLIILFFLLFLYKAHTQSWELFKEVPAGIDCISTYGSEIYLGSIGDGVHYSFDNGKTWQKSISGIENIHITNIIKTNNHFFIGTVSNGVFHSTDLKGKWSKISDSQIFNKTIYSMVYQNNNIYLCNSIGIYKSSDLGKSWISIYHQDGFSIVCLAVKNKSIYGGGQFGICYSNDSGNTWTYLRDDGNSFIWPQIISINFDKYDVYAGDNSMGLFYSSNSGKNWKPCGGYMNIKSILIYKKFVFMVYGGITMKPLNDSTCYYYYNLYDSLIQPANNIAVNEEYLFASSYKGLQRMPISILDEPDVKISGSSSVCVGDTVSYSSKYQKYLFTKWRVEGGTLDSTSNDSLFKVIWQSPGTGRIVLTKYNDLIELSDSTILEININEYPPKPKIRYIKDTLWSDSPEGNQWFKNGKVLTGENKNYYYTSDSGSFSVQVTLNGCSSEMSDTINLEALGVEDTQETNVFSVSPNPATDFIEISLPKNNHTLKGMVESVRIYNVFGEEVLNESKTMITNSKLTFNISNLSPGLYIIRNGTIFEKFIKY